MMKLDWNMLGCWAWIRGSRIYMTGEMLPEHRPRTKIALGSHGEPTGFSICFWCGPLSTPPIFPGRLETDGAHGSCTRSVAQHESMVPYDPS